MTLRFLATFVSLCLCLVAQVARADLPKIMPLGDSITAGWNQPSYRLPLYRALQAQNCQIDFVGQQTLTSRSAESPGRYPGLHFPTFSARSHPGYAAEEHWHPAMGDDTDHEGYPGLKAAALLRRTWAAIRMAQPDYVLLHIGTNDILDAPDFRHNKADMVKFAISIVGKINEIMAAVFSSHRNPQDVKILLANLIPTDPRKRQKFWIDEPALSRILTRYINVLAENKNDPRIILVDVASNFDHVSMTTDGIHPNAEGEQFLADAWMQALFKAGLCQ